MPRKKMNLPKAGAAFAFPIGDGRFSVCRVILEDQSKDGKGNKGIVVATSSWIGDQIPDATDPALRSVLHLNHHNWKNDPQLMWISEELPEDFIPIRMIEPTSEETGRDYDNKYGTWGCVRIQPLMQWRWDHDREAVLAEDAAAARTKAQAKSKAQLDRQDYLSRVTLLELRGRHFLPNWKKTPPIATSHASRKCLADTVERLITLGTDASDNDRMTELKRCIESFNELNDRFNEFIETEEREDICEEFEAIVHACGFRNHPDLADQWREW